MGAIKQSADGADRASRASGFCLACCLLLLVLLCLPLAGSAATGMPATGMPATGMPATGMPATAQASADNGMMPAHADFAFAEPYFETLWQGKLPSTIITALLQDAQGWLWIGTQFGLFRYDGYHTRKFAHDAANPTSLAGNYVSALWQAPDRRLWVGTYSDGVSIFDPQTGQFTHLRHDPARAACLAGGEVWAMAGDGKGGVWIGTDQGLDYVSDGAPSDGLPLHQYRHEPNNPASLLDNRIRSLLFDKQGRLWVGSAGGLQRYQAAKAGQPASFVRDGKLWLGTEKQGAVWLNLTEPDPTLHWLPVDPQLANRLSHAAVTSIIEPQAGQIWLGTYGGGINIVAAQDGAVLQRLRHDPANGYSLAHDAIRPMMQDHSGIVWLGTWGGGLQRHHPAQQAFKVLRHHPVGPRMVGPRMATGLSHHDVRSVLELSDGRILVGTGGNGIDILDRRRGVVGGYRPLLPGLRLRPDQRNFSVEFAALDFSNSDLTKTRYRYQLQGYDQAWINTDSQHRLASYGNLWPGQYTLQVQGSNSEGEWSDKLLTLPIEIEPAFWQTPWFSALLLLLLSSAIWGGHHWRLARIQAQARALQHEVKQRTAEAVAAHQEALEAHNEAVAAQNELALARQLEQAREQMLQQEKMAALGTLTAGVAHEINNPTSFAHVAGQNLHLGLNEFQQYLMDLLQDDPDPDTVAAFARRFADLEHDVSTLLNGTERIKTIVKDLRAFSRREHEQKRTVHLSEYLASTRNLVRSSWASQVEFINEFEADPAYECWPTLLNQVFMNLIVNGCHAIAGKRQHNNSAEPGHLWLRLRQRERDGQNWLVVEIEDDGCGIEPHVRERILEPFFTTKDANTGTGLGLSIAHGIIQKHGGTLSIASTPGQGSCFTIHFPWHGDTPGQVDLQNLST